MTSWYGCGKPDFVTLRLTAMCGCSMSFVFGTLLIRNILLLTGEHSLTNHVRNMQIFLCGIMIVQSQYKVAGGIGIPRGQNLIICRTKDMKGSSNDEIFWLKMKSMCSY